MIIGSSHGVGGGPTQTEVLSTVVAQLEPIHATCMEEVNKNIDQIIQYMEIGARGFPGYDLFVRRAGHAPAGAPQGRSHAGFPRSWPPKGGLRPPEGLGHLWRHP